MIQRRSTETLPRDIKRPVMATMALLFALHCAFLLLFAFQLRLDYFDSFEILANARTIAGQAPENWHHRRALVMPLLLSFFARTTPEVFFIVSHIMAMIITLATVVATWRLCRLSAGEDLHASPVALFSALLFSINDLVVHNAVMAKEDILATLFLTLTTISFLRPPQNLRAGRWGCLFAGLTMATRFNLIPMVYFILFLHFVSDRPRFARALTLGATPILLFFLFPMILYPAIGLSDIPSAPGLFMEYFLEQFRFIRTTDQSVRVYYNSLATSCSLPVIALAIGGAITGIWRREREMIMVSAIFLTAFILHGFLIGVKESRYMLPFLPLIYAAAASALVRIARKRPGGRIGVALLAACLLILPLARLHAEYRRLLDPVYGNDFVRDLSVSAAGLAKEKPISWVGSFYAIAPQDFVIYPGDPYASIFHMYAHHVEFHTGRPVMTRRLNGMIVSPGAAGIFHPVLKGRSVVDGEVLIINRDPEMYRSWSLPAERLLLVVTRARIREGRAVGGDTFSRGFTVAGGRIEMKSLAGSGEMLSGEGLPDGFYQLQFTARGFSVTTDTFIAVQGGRFQTTTSVMSPGISPERIDLVSYESQREFKAP